MSNPIDAAPSVSFSHLGLCVSDLDRSLAFYCDGLGFQAHERHEIDDTFAALMELPSVTLTSQFIRQGAVAIELLHFSDPLAAPQEHRAINRAGLTHLSVRVTDLESTAARLVDLGGSIVEGTRTEIPMGAATLRFIYLTDPDGTRVELMELPG